MIAVVALVGCSADAVHSPQKFFPGSALTSWDDCSKFGSTSNVVAVCAQTGIVAGTDSTAYFIEFFIPSPEHVRIAVFDQHAVLVKVLFDADEPATLPGTFRPAIHWGFTDTAGRHVQAGDYRVYFQAGSYISTSDVAVE